MGATMSMIQRMRFWKKELRIVMVGLDMAGKTTILYKLKLGQIVENHATIVFNMETVEYNDVDFLVFDVPRRETIEPIWRNHCLFAQGLIFVVDSNDRERILEARDELHRMLKEPELRNEAALLVFANKKDLQNVLSVSDIILKLDLHSLHPRRWYVQAACATSGEGLYEGLNWLSNSILS